MRKGSYYLAKTLHLKFSLQTLSAQPFSVDSQEFIVIREGS